ncbi:MerR family transcriptional regulator [Streptosporangium sp. KLBMP 9127]|nr:MerR family transcriptional regulator [Streptosporangium sp. KLBMP 9127]
MDEGAPETGDQEPGFGIGAVSRRIGVPAPTLRTWNVRYGIGPSRRSPGGHRRYDSTDVRRLEEMSRLIRAGVAPADAAREARRLPGTRPGAARPDTTSTAERPGIPEEVVGSPAVLARSALMLDGPAVAETLARALVRRGVVWTWEKLVLPVFATMSAKQAETGLGIEAEHLFSDRILSALIGLADRPRRPVHPRVVLLACAEEEQHSLPVYALAAALAREHNVETRVLGARTPYGALGDAMRRVGPIVVFVWSQQESTGDPAPLAALPHLRPASRVIVGGPGWWDALPSGVTRVTRFQEAISQVRAASR